MTMLLYRISKPISWILTAFLLPDIAIRKVCIYWSNIFLTYWWILLSIPCFSQETLEAQLRDQIVDNTNRITRIEVGGALICTLALTLTSIAWGIYQKTNTHSITLAKLEVKSEYIQKIIEDLKILVTKSLKS